jgi:DNA helicase-2/ATP-dependent DNA helicase PcrA
MPKTIPKTTFDDIYKGLNKEQKQAVDAIEGPVMVIAGPGTGKTSILTLRIANIVRKTDTSPDTILALTFTESGMNQMRRKLVEIIGTAAYKVKISTFHGFCNDVIKEYPERFPRIIGSTAITEIDQIAIMEKIIDGEGEEKGSAKSPKIELLKPFGDPLFYVRPALGEIRKLKREAISPADFKEGIAAQEKDFENEPEKIHVKGAHKGKMKGEFVKLQGQIEKNKELHKLYEAYEKALVEGKFYDFEDMIVEVVKILKKDSDLLLILQETYQYILADEHQDANNAQNAIIELLSNFHENPNLFIVGDEKQAIFRFQGASLENFLYFKKLYPKAVLINLEKNYRSTQHILDASYSLISNNTSGVEHVRLKSSSEALSKNSPKKDIGPILIHEFVNADSEHDFVAKDIQNKIGTGEKLEEIAVLYRNNDDAFAIGYALEKAGIAYRVESDADILKNEEIRKLLIIFEAVNDLANEEFLAKVFFIDFFEIEPLDVFKALDAARKEKKRLYEIAGGLMGGPAATQFRELSKKLSSWASLAHNKPFVEVFEIIIRESGFLAHALKSDNSFEKLATLQTFFTQVRELAGAKKQYYLKDFITHLERVREHGINTKTHSANFKAGVRLMTAHRSKGLEFDYVYIIGAYDGHWGNKSTRNFFHIPQTAGASSAGIDDERRLFYVALTRARKGVAISYAKEGNEGREQLPAQFIGEIDEKLKKFEGHSERVKIQDHFVTSHKSDKKAGQKTQENQKGEKADQKMSPENKRYLQELFLEQGLSVTALNNYLRCPWDYFFVNLIRVPKAQSKHQMYGTAVHETLKTFFDKYRVEEDMKKDELLHLFEFNLNKLPLAPGDFTDTLKKGKKTLGAYFDTYKGSWPRNLLTEFSIKGVHLESSADSTKGTDSKSSFGTLLLKGNLDKIEFINEKEVNVVDYKTGKSAKKEKLEDYHRQIIFYKLLLDLDEKKKYQMKTGELDFVEPDDKGKFKKIKYEVTDAEVQELIKLIQEKAKEIYNLEFWNKTCDDKTCEYCRLSKSIVKR